MNTGCFKCDKAQWDADGCTCEITGLLVGNAERGCEYRKDTKLKPCPFCGGEATLEKLEPRLYRPFRNGVYSITCYSCDLNFGYDLDYGRTFKTEEEAVKAWNRRAENAE